MIVSGFDTRRKNVLADLAGNFCSFFESKHTESETALGSTHSLALGHTHDCLGSHATIVLNFREENFCDQKSNHEIHENIVPQKFGAIR